MFLVFESSFWFFNFTNKCLNFALMAICPMKELKLIELSLFLRQAATVSVAAGLLFLLSSLVGALLKMTPKISSSIACLQPFKVAKIGPI